MHLLDLPNEILEKIAHFLDLASLIDFASTNLRLGRASLDAIKTLRVRRILPPLLMYLEVNGSSVRRLDLSNSPSDRDGVEAVIGHCYNITDLNIVNTDFDDLSLLCDLKKLESFSVTASHRLARQLKKSLTFPSIKRVYLDSSPSLDALSFSLRFVNACSAIEVVHINLFGAVRNDALNTMPVLSAERWNTLHTVILSRHLTIANFRVRALLRQIFAHNSHPGIEEWTEAARDYFIYERGNLSGSAPKNIDANNDIRLLRQYHAVDLPPGGNVAAIFGGSWGAPRAVRIHNLKCPLSGLEDHLSTSIVELNLRGCHRSEVICSLADLIAALPNLRAFACTVCYFLPESSELGIIKSHKETFGNAMRKLRLKKLFVEGFSFIRDYTSICRNCREPLTSLNLLDLGSFRHLEELTFNGVDLDTSAYLNMANSNVRTVILCLNAKNNYGGLRDFILKCGNLRHLKLEGFDLQMHLQNVWKALVGGHALKQICLRSGIGGFSDSVFQGEFLDNFVQILKRLEFLHLHSPDPRFSESLSKFLMKSKHRDLWRKVHSDTVAFSVRNVKSACLDRTTVGRSLCYSDSSAGIVHPVGWEVE